MDKSGTQVSIILPCHNADPVLLTRTVDSVLAQSYPSFELLFVDDGSEAAFAQALEREAQRDPRFRLLKQDASGVSAARNNGIRSAAGEYVTFLDADDTLSSRFLEEAVMAAGELRADYLIGGTCYIFTGETEPDAGSAGSLDPVADAIALTPRRLPRTKAECIGAPYRFDANAYINRGIAARLIKKEILKDAYLFPEGLRIAEDASWNLQLVCGGFRGYYVPGIWYYYYENAQSVSNRYNPDVIRDMEDHLAVIGRQMDLRRGIEYKAYMDLMMDDLRYIYKCMLGHPDWKAAKAERREIKAHLYKDRPWNAMGDLRYLKLADTRNRFKAYLYRMHLLFAFWALRKGA